MSWLWSDRMVAVLIVIGLVLGIVSAVLGRYDRGAYDMTMVLFLVLVSD